MATQVSYSLRDATRLPSLISLARLPLALAFPWVASKPVLAIGLLAAAALSDILDGQVARRCHQVTATGAALDALMDKVFVLAVVLSLLLGGSLTVLEALLLGTRDIAELPLAIRVARGHRIHRVARSSNPFGKLATVLQFMTLVAILLGTPHRGFWVLATGACGVLAAASYWVREERPQSPKG